MVSGFYRTVCRVMSVFPNFTFNTKWSSERERERETTHVSSAGNHMSSLFLYSDQLYTELCAGSKRKRTYCIYGLISWI